MEDENETPSIDTDNSDDKLVIEEKQEDKLVIEEKQEDKFDKEEYAYLKNAGFSSEAFKIEIKNLPKFYGKSLNSTTSCTTVLIIENLFLRFR